MSTTTAFTPTPAHQLRGAPGLAVPDTRSKNAATNGAKGTVVAPISFSVLPENGEKPYNWAGANADNPPNGIPRNFSSQDRDVEINDIRGHESDYNLDQNAFAAFSGVNSQMKYDDWSNEDTIKNVYYPEVEQLLLSKVPGSKRIFIFDHTIRRPPSSGHNRSAVMRAHIDQTAKSTEARIRYHLPSEADALLQNRYRLINVWRPINGSVQSHPLAVADSSSVDNNDLWPVEHRYPDRTGETAAVSYNPAQKWLYWGEMDDEERLLLKCFDSDSVASPSGRVPHTAFEHPGTPEGAKGRESIEVRALVFD